MGIQATPGAAPPNAFTVAMRDDGVAVVTLDMPGERMNVLQTELIAQADRVFQELRNNPGLKGVVLISGKPDSFIAGADVHMLARCGSAEEATRLSREGQAFCHRLQHFAVPVVAAIHGICLGGGLELVMACGGRVASNSPKTALGLPEVKLGLLPGSGGTQRLPALVGIQAALDMMLTGRQVSADKALRMGLIQDVVPQSILLDAAVKLLGELERNAAPGRPGRPGHRGGLRHWLLERTPWGRKLVWRQARKTVEARTRGNYPAPPRIIDCVELGANQGLEQGLELEARSFGELATTPQARALMQVHLATVAMKKDSGTLADVSPRPVSRTAVLGAGLMGAGISYVTAGKAQTPVRLKDIATRNLSQGMQYVDQRIRERIRRHSISAFQGGLELRRVTPTLDWSGFGSVDLVMEAVFEDLELKHKMLREVEVHCPERTIFASNTSSIPIADIAAAASRPQNVIGMHYFSPVEKMPLLEIIATANTAPEVIATAVAFGRRQGKTPIVVGDGAGFYVNRILGPYINEANHLLMQGVAIDQVDQALLGFGFPVGPFALLDEVGLDVSAKVATILHQAFGVRMAPPETTARMLNDQRSGKKNRKGFYTYPSGKHKKPGKQVDASVYRLLGVEPTTSMAAGEISKRCVLVMLNEAARCLDEAVIRSPRDGDIGAIFGIGFPPFLGGPFRYMDAQGIATVVAYLQALQQSHAGSGKQRFAPAEILLRMADHEQTFYQRE